MRYLYFDVCIVLLIFGLATVYAQHIPFADRKPLIDETFKKYEIKIKKEIEKCREDAKRFIDKLNCVDTVFDSHKTDKEDRASTHYCEKHYKPLSDEELEKTYGKLKRQLDVARREADVTEPESGELTIEMLKFEINWIQHEYADRKAKKRQGT